MKKLITMMLVLVLTLGFVAPQLTFADETDGRVATDVGLETRVKTDDTDVNVRARAQANADVRKETRERVKVRIAEVRTNAKETRERVKTRVENARERYDERRDALQERRNTFHEVRVDLRTCETDDADACAELRAEFNAHAARFLLSTAETLITHIDRLADHMEKQDVGEEYADELREVRANVEADIDAIGELGDDPSREELARISASIKESWNTVKRITNAVVQASVDDKVSDGTAKMVNLEARLIAVRDDLADQGGDTSELDALLREFSSLLDIVEEGGNDEMTAREAFKEATHMLREIMHEIRDIRAELRGAGNDSDSPPVVGDAMLEAEASIEDARGRVADVAEAIDAAEADGVDVTVAAEFLADAQAQLTRAETSFAADAFSDADAYAAAAVVLAADAEAALEVE